MDEIELIIKSSLIQFGLIALLATIIHEVPHEMSDFALLLRDGYTRGRAITAQVS